MPGTSPLDLPETPVAPRGSSIADLPRRLGFWATTALVIGTTIGSGIFRVPATVAADVGSVAGVAAVWILGGLITLCGTLATAETAAAFPRSGGVFIYLREPYGPAVAFLYGWTMLFLAPASTAAVSLVFAEYASTLIPLSPFAVRVVAAGLILLVAMTVYRSVVGAGAIQTAATVGKLAALVVLIGAAFLLGDGTEGSFGRGAPVGIDPRGGIGVALVAALWAYNGFQDMVPIAGEVRNPGTVLPRALIAGIAVVIAVYLSANAAYLYVLPFADLLDSPLVSSDAMVRVVGASGSTLVAAMVMTSTFGTVNALVLAQPRVFYAMARENLLFASLARVHPRYGTPHVAVVWFTVAALVCVWSRTFEQLTEAFVLGIWPFLALSVAGVIVLRRTRPGLERPYSTPGYPLVPLIFIAGVLWVVGSALIARPVTTLAGMGMTLLGIPVYLLWQRARQRVAAR